MTLDDRLQASIGQVDPGLPDVAAELRTVERLAIRRRRRRRVTAALVVAAASATLVAVVVRAQGEDHREIGTTPAPTRTSRVLVPRNLPAGMTLIAVEPPSRGWGSSGSEGPFSFTRTYAQFSPDQSRVERSFQIDVGTGDENAEVFRVDSGVPIEINGLPAKVSGDESHSTVIWFDTEGRIFRLIGDISRDDALRTAAHLVIDPAVPLKPRSARLDELPEGFQHLFDQTNPRITSLRDRTTLIYATPNRDATLQLEIQRHPTETVDEHLLFENARVVEVRGHRGVYVEGLLSGGRELRWSEPGVGLVTMTATTLPGDQFRAIAEQLDPISDARWKRLRDEVGPLGSSAGTDQTPEATVTPLAPIGPDVVAAHGSLDEGNWTLVVYEVAPADGRTERRFCYELRGDQPAPQSCFPLRPDEQSWMWLYGERRLGRWFLLGAAPHGAPSELAPDHGQPVPLQIHDDPDLPMQVFVAVLPEPYDGTFSIRDQGGQSVAAGGPAIEGSRLPWSLPSLPGVYPEFPLPPLLTGGIGPSTPPPTATTPTTNARGTAPAPNRTATVQILNGSGVNGLATMRSEQLTSLGWKVLPPDNYPHTHAGNAVQCDHEHDRVARQLRVALRALGIEARSEPTPRPRPAPYDRHATCYVILGT